MGQLVARDVGLLNNCIRDIYSCLNSEGFPGHVLSTMSKVIPSGIMSYRTIFPLKHKSVHFTIPSEIGSAKNHVLYTKYMHEHPYLNLLYPKEMLPHPFKRDLEKKADRLHIFNNIPKTGWAIKISDFLTAQQWRKLGLYNELFHKIDAEYQISIPLLNNKFIHTALTFNRDRMDFSEQERVILNLLCPHIIQAYQNAETVADVQKKADVLEGTIEETGSSVIVIDKDYRILFCTNSAQRLLTDSFKPSFRSVSRLPEKLEKWVRYQRMLLSAKTHIPSPPTPLLIDKQDRSLIIRFIHNNKKRKDILLIREELKISPVERLQSFGITAREAIVLYWVAQGKTNEEVASILNISIGTVKKHLERTYQKLGVENRVSASLIAMESLGITKWRNSICSPS